MPRTSPHFAFKLLPKQRIDRAYWENQLALPNGTLRNLASGRNQLTGPLIAQVLMFAPDQLDVFLQLFHAVPRTQAPGAYETPETPEPEAPVVPAEKPAKRRKGQSIWDAPDKADEEPHGDDLPPFAWEAWEYRRLIKAGKEKKAAKYRAEIEALLPETPKKKGKK